MKSRLAIAQDKLSLSISGKVSPRCSAGPGPCLLVTCLPSQYRRSPQLGY